MIDGEGVFLFGAGIENWMADGEPCGWEIFGEYLDWSSSNYGDCKGGEMEVIKMVIFFRAEWRIGDIVMVDGLNRVWNDVETQQKSK